MVLKVLLYSMNFAPEPTGIGKYSGEMAAWLASHGHEVRVVCAPPYYPAWRMAPGYAWPPYQREQWQGVQVFRAPVWVPAQPGGLKRVLHLLSFAVSSVPNMLRQVVWKPDVVLTVAPAFACAPLGWLTARLSGARAWLHVQDFELDVAFKLGLLKGAWAQRLLKWLELTVLCRFDRVSSISQRMLQRLVDKGVSAQRVTLFPNWVDCNDLQPWAGGSRYFGELGIDPAAVVVLFSGTLGHKQGLLQIPPVARLLAHRPEIVFVVCGDGVMKPALQRACEGLSNVHLMPLQPAERLSELLGMASIHLLTQNLDAEDLVLPSKLSAMLASGRPVVATCRAGSEIAEMLADCGLVVDPDDQAALAAAIGALADQPDQRTKMGNVARELAVARLGTGSVLSRLQHDLHNLVMA